MVASGQLGGWVVAEHGACIPLLAPHFLGLACFVRGSSSWQPGGVRRQTDSACLACWRPSAPVAPAPAASNQLQPLLPDGAERSLPWQLRMAFEQHYCKLYRLTGPLACSLVLLVLVLVLVLGWCWCGILNFCEGVINGCCPE